MKKPKAAKKRINSRQKGKRGELEFVHFLAGYGIESRRGQQFKGGTDSPDVVALGMCRNIHFEVKRVQSGSPYKWFEQACADADICKVPVVAHKRNNKPWLAILDMCDLLNLLPGGSLAD